ncbi:seryl-trna synthetase [Lasius niger]|uniref:Seryl-trna synthetase n=1 Tax=Lasius niger TaxID=67767 RepID=A0A0J7NBQ0_LASNI|nr:seryl-trna synthetase [Lasius niger]
MTNTHFSSQKAFILSGFLASIAFFSAPLNAAAADLALANVPHASDIQPEIAKKVAPDKELRSNLTDAETQLKETENALSQVISDHKKGQATADEVATHIQMLSDNISALDDKIKAIEAAPKSKAHTKWIKEGKAKKVIAVKDLNTAKQSQ